jgi:hypothetical protein
MYRTETDEPPIPVVINIYKRTEVTEIIVVQRDNDDVLMRMYGGGFTSVLSFASLMKGRGIALISSPYRSANHMAINGLLVADWDSQFSEE